MSEKCLLLQIKTKTMNLIVDSGSTKADWCITDGGLLVSQTKTDGINPVFQSDGEIMDLLEEALEKMGNAKSIDRVYFYGAGVRENTVEKLYLDIEFVFITNNLNTNTLKICVEGDLMGAARALLKDSEGIACILGTGANSCLYDGKKIVDNVPPMGYILGDEGSGAVLGKTLLNAMYKRRLPKEILDGFEAKYEMSLNDIIDKVYREPKANRFLASLSPFVKSNIADGAVEQMVVEHFESFFRNNVASYGRRDLPVSFVGSIAYYFEQQLKEAASHEGFTVGTIVKSPLYGLVDYHSAMS